MDFDLLADFLAVMEHGSILAAAEARETSQPTLSRRIRDLEDALGVLLLNRTSRGVSPTRYGEAFKVHAEKLLRDRQRALDDLRAIRSGTRGHARIGIAPALSGYLPTAIMKLQQAEPDLTFEILDGTYDTLIRKTLTGEIDGAFTMLPPGESVESLGVRPLGPEPVLVAAGHDHRLVDVAKITLADLAGERWILMNRPRSILDAFAQFTRASGLANPQAPMETSSLDFLKSIVGGSDFLTAVPRGAVHAELEDGSFRALDIPGLPDVDTAFVHRHGVLPPLIIELVREVVDAQKAAQG